MKAAEKYARDYFIRDHGITQETLDAFGIVFRANGVVVLPYEGRLRERIDLPVARPDGKRFVWGESDVPITPFNVDDGHKHTVFITEGESDAMRLWQDVNEAGKTLRCGVVGLPGVESWKDGWTPRFEGAEAIYVVLDNSTGYDEPDQVERAWRKMRAALGKRCKRVYLREDCKDLTEFLEKYGYAVFTELVRKEATAGRVHWPGLDLTKPPEPPDWLLTNIIARSQTSVIVGVPWGGKSFWCLGLVHAIMKGASEYCGMQLNCSRDAKILIVDEENGPLTPLWRLKKLGFSEAELESDQIKYICRQGVRLDIHAAELMDEAVHMEPDLLIFDSFDRLHRGEANSSAEVSAMFTDCLMPLAHGTGAALLLLHHENKPPQMPKNGRPVFRSFEQRSRGSGALAEAADTGLILEIDPDDKYLKHLRMGGTRSSNLAPGEVLCSFRISDTPVGGIEILSANGEGNFEESDDEF